MRSGATAKKWKRAFVVVFAVCASAAPTVALAEGTSGSRIEWGGDVVARPVRLSRDPLIIEAVVETGMVSDSDHASPVRLLIEQLSPCRRTVLDVPMTVREEGGRRVHRFEWSMSSTASRPRPGEYMFTLITSSRRGFAPATSSLRVDVWPSAVKRLPGPSSEIATKPDVEIVIIGRQQVAPTT